MPVKSGHDHKTISKGMLACALAISATVSPGARAQWDPESGDYGKSSPHDVRIMTWNVRDSLRTGAVKQEGFNAWTGMARHVATLQPDVLVLQECADNGFPGGVDSAAELDQLMEVFLEGGSDPFQSGNPQITAYVNKYAPDYHPDNFFASGLSDGFNRNAIMTVFDDQDLNGDGKSRLNDMFSILAADEYAVGGAGGIRGFQFMELDLPDNVYRGELIIGNGHLKSGSSSDDVADRRSASRNLAYFVDYFYNGAGQGVPDPNSVIFDLPQATALPTSLTPVVLGGDLNEDEGTNGGKGPASWLAEAEFAGSDDGTDRDRTDATMDQATEYFSGNRRTIGAGITKFDYVIWQDRTTTARNQFVFDSGQIPGESMPVEFDGMTFPQLLSGLVSDHRPVIVDFILPVWHDGDRDGDVDLLDIANAQLCPGLGEDDFGDLCEPHDTNEDGIFDAEDIVNIINLLSGPATR